MTTEGSSQEKTLPLTKSVAAGWSPDVFVEAPYGETNGAVYVGQMNMTSLDVTDLVAGIKKALQPTATPNPTTYPSNE